MKSLSTARRVSPAWMICISGIVAFAVAVCCVFVVQHAGSKSFESVSHLFVTDPIASRPLISSSSIKQPVVAMTAPAENGDTGAAVTQTAVAQSAVAGSSVSYQSLQISDSQRDRLLVVAVSFVIIGVSLYAMSMLSIPQRPVTVSRRPLYKVLDT